MVTFTTTSAAYLAGYFYITGRQTVQDAVVGGDKTEREPSDGTTGKIAVRVHFVPISTQK
jgi:hypothetical protein